jgi:hypothetical protein
MNYGALEFKNTTRLKQKKSGLISYVHSNKKTKKKMSVCAIQIHMRTS